MGPEALRIAILKGRLKATREVGCKKPYLVTLEDVHVWQAKTREGWWKKCKTASGSTEIQARPRFQVHGLRINEAAKAAGVTRPTILRAILSGELRAERVPCPKHSAYVLAPHDVQQWQERPRSRRGRPRKNTGLPKSGISTDPHSPSI